MPTIDRIPHGAVKDVDGKLQRLNAGRNHWYKINGVKADGVTSIINGSVPKNLTGWAAEQVAKKFVNDFPWMQEAVDKFGAEGFIKACKELPNKDRDEAANRGTEVHKLAELLTLGEEVDVPEPLEGHVDAFLDYRARWKPTGEMVEATVGNFTYNYAGSLDNWAHIRPYPCCATNGCLSLIDYKTNRSGPFGETALQLGAYDSAEVYIDAAGILRNMPKFAHHFVLWLRSDGWDLIPFEITDVERMTFLYCQQVAKWTDWKKGRSGQVKKPALEVPSL